MIKPYGWLVFKKNQKCFITFLLIKLHVYLKMDEIVAC